MKTRIIFRCVVAMVWLVTLQTGTISLNAQDATKDSTQNRHRHLRRSYAMNRVGSDRIFNNHLFDYHHNDHFRTSVARRDSAFRITTWHDTVAPLKQLDKKVFWAIRMEDFVYFNPLECFLFPFRASLPERRRLFFRQKVMVPRMTYPEITPIPYALRFYLDTSQVYVVPGQTRLSLAPEADLLPEPFLSPFYFRKYLVTNAEYREFVHYVRDSIARTMLFEAGLTRYGRMVPVTDSTGETINTLVINSREPILWKDPLTDSLLAGLYIPPERRFFRLKQVDSEVLVYRSPSSGHLTVPVVIYPDTSAWINDFPIAFMEPRTRNYFWHPAYDHYPVVGVNFWQVMAYLDWKTEKYQRELDRRGLGIRVVCELPNEAQWDMVSTAAYRNGEPELYPVFYHEMADRSWITNLQLNDKQIQRPDSMVDSKMYVSLRSCLLAESLTDALVPRYSFQIDDHMVTHPARPVPGSRRAARRFHRSDRDRLLHRADPGGIFDMGGNVSEWLSDSYDEQWLPIFTLRQEMLATFTDPDVLLMAALEQYFNNLNDTNGRLVRGTNWYDRRYSYHFGKNIPGLQAKRFVDPEKSYSTLGFRYVVRFEYQ